MKTINAINSSDKKKKSQKNMSLTLLGTISHSKNDSKKSLIKNSFRKS